MALERIPFASVLLPASPPLPNPSQRLPGRPRARLHVNCSACSIVLGHQFDFTAITAAIDRTNAAAAPPPRRTTDHVLRHRNINVCSSAGLLPARATTHRNKTDGSNPEAPAPTTGKSSETRRPPGPTESAKTLLLPAPCFTYRRSINEARLAPDEEPGRGRAPLVSKETIN